MMVHRSVVQRLPCNTDSALHLPSCPLPGTTSGIVTQPPVFNARRKINNFASAIGKLHDNLDQYKKKCLEQWRLVEEDPAAELVGTKALEFFREFVKKQIGGAANGHVIQSYFDFHLDANFGNDGGCAVPAVP